MPGSILDISRAGSVRLDRMSVLALDRVACLDLASFGAAIPWELPTGSHWVIPLGSIFAVGGGAGSIYLANGFDDEEVKVAFPVPRALRVLKMNLAATLPPGSGQSFAYVLRKGNVAGTSFADAGLSVVVSNAEVEDEADGSVDFARGERLCVKLTKTAGVPTAWHVGGLEIELL